MDRNILSRPAKDRPRWAYKAGSGLTSVLLRPTGSSSEEVGKQMKFYTRVANSTLQRLRGTDLRAVVVSQTRFSTRLSADWDMLCDDPPRRAATRRRWDISNRPTVTAQGGMRVVRDVTGEDVVEMRMSRSGCGVAVCTHGREK